MNAKPSFLLLAAISALSFSARAGLPVTVANDNADLPDYAIQPNHNWSVVNGGFGYSLWTALGGAGGGGTYMDGVGVNGRQVDGNYSYALYAGGGSFAISRPLSSSIASGEFDITTRFDIAGNGPNLFSIRTGNNTSGFGAGELLSFGIIGSVDASQLSFTDGSGVHLLPSGEARGAVWGWNIDFNAAAGTYSGSVMNLGGGYSATFSGNLEASGTSVGSFAAMNSSSGDNQNLIFDNPTFSVPEPSVAALFGLSSLGLLGVARRRK